MCLQLTINTVLNKFPYQFVVMIVLAKNFQAFPEFLKMHIKSVILFIPKLRIRGRMDSKTILLKQTYPDERRNKLVSCILSLLLVLNAKPA